MAAAALATHATSYMTSEVDIAPKSARDFGTARDAAPAGLTSSPARWIMRELSAKMAWSDMFVGLEVAVAHTPD